MLSKDIFRIQVRAGVCDSVQQYEVIKHNNIYVVIIIADCDSEDGGNARRVEMQKCEAYEIIKLSKQKVVMESNPAYGEIGRISV